MTPAASPVTARCAPYTLSRTKQPSGVRLDAGATWQAVRTAIFPNSSESISDVRALDAAADTVFVSGLAGGVSGVHAYTFDSGITWHSFRSRLPHRASPALTGLAGPAQRLVLLRRLRPLCPNSTDYGATWADATPFDQSTHPCGIYQDPFADSTIYAFGSYYWYAPNNTQRGGIERSTDLGSTWTSLSPLHDIGVDDALVTGMTRLTNGDLMALIRAFPTLENGNVLRSTDNGASWQQVYGGLTDRFWPDQIVEDRLAPGTVFLEGAARTG